jgi:hypothetical protein
MNLSLIILGPYLIYVLLIKPFQFTIKMATETSMKPAKAKPKNIIELEELPQLPIDTPFLQAIPSQLYDSLLITLVEGNRMKLSNVHNGFYYSHPLLVQPVNQFYVCPIPAYKQLAVLALTPPIHAQSQFMLLDSLGVLIYHQEFNEYLNRMSLTQDGKVLVLQQIDINDSLLFKKAYRLMP